MLLGVNGSVQSVPLTESNSIRCLPFFMIDAVVLIASENSSSLLTANRIQRNLADTLKYR
ncbi:hypothetical protein AOQ84DRAFT_75742 [Glonium stellatum]|uniref:Uncharacterized protein n=1 Tax=Glonium stellatum TaxID=574774 RepID=A0A8E2EXT1_9PEZI|nr:hypothetical protein AOQ84DRAFT_75742 [Glonium stellatum]